MPFNEDQRRLLAQKNAHLYNGLIHGEDEYGIMDIEFPYMFRAADFVRNMDWEDRAEIRSDENGVSVVAFNRAVVIQVQLGELPE